LVEHVKSTIFDDKQRKAINLPFDVSAYIEAPPGFGKTFIMGRRIECLLRRGDIKKPFQVLGLTYTNAAANEMQRRIIEVLPYVKDQVEIFNFHALCYIILKSYGYLIGIKRNFIIFSNKRVENERKNALNRILNDNSIKESEKTAIINGFNIWYDKKIIKHENFSSKYDNIYNDAIEEYKKYLKGSNCIDFNHLLLFTIELFNTYPKILEYYRKSFHYILVDEFQDTNPMQYQILKLLIEGIANDSNKVENRSFMIFADPYQSIFMFNGATPDKNIARLKNDFPRIRKIELEQSHRTNSELLNFLVKKYRDKSGKIKIPSNTPLIPLIMNSSKVDEINTIIRLIKDIPTKIPRSEICIISRKKNEWARISKFPARLRDKSIESIFLPDYSAGGIESVFSNVFEEMEQNRDNRTITLLEDIINKLLNKFNISSPIEIIKLMQEIARKVDNEYFNVKLGYRITHFLNKIRMELDWGNLLKKRLRNKVFISSIHGVKGLEFEYVILVGVKDTSFFRKVDCEANSISYNDKIKEAINLLYVAITRAKSQIYFFYVKYPPRLPPRIKISCILEPIKKFIRYIDNEQGKSLSLSCHDLYFCSDCRN